MQAVVFDIDHTLLDANDAAYEGAHELLAILRQLGLKILGITNGDHRAIVRLDQLDLRKHFSSVLCADQITAPKVVEGVHHLLRMADVTADQAMLVSHAYSDILLARDAGLAKTVAVSHGSDHTKVLERAGADCVVDDLSGVLDVVS